MTCTGAYASVSDWEAKFCKVVGEANRAQMCRNLGLAASDIQIALAATGACGCTFSAWATTFVKNLNVIIAGAFYKCPCSNITAEDRAAMQEQANIVLGLIRSGELELCHGETGSTFPYTADAAQGVTEWARRDIIVNDILRNS